MYRLIAVFGLSLLGFTALHAQKKTIAQLKTELEKSTNPPLYVKDVLKKKFILDTVLIFSTSRFGGVRDSLAYKGKVGKVYGPYDKGRVLVQILDKSKGPFNRVSQIFLDTSIYTKRFADSLAGSIASRIQSGAATFEDMVMTYSTGAEVADKGDLGWLAVGSMLPEIEKEMKKRKKGEVFKVWTKSGLHILQKTQDSKQDVAAALIMRILL